MTVDAALALAALACANTGNSAAMCRALVLAVLALTIAGLGHRNRR